MNHFKLLKPIKFDKLKTDVVQARELQTALNLLITTKEDIGSTIQDASLRRAFDAERLEGRFGEKSIAMLQAVQKALDQPASSEEGLTALLADTLNQKLNLTALAVPARTAYTLSGIARNELGLPMANVQIEVFEPGIGGETQLTKPKSVQTDANGFYTLTVEALDPKTLPTNQNELLIRAYTAAGKEQFAVRQSLSDQAKLVQDVFVSQKEAAILTEFSAISNAASTLAGNKQLADLTEKDGRSDITQLHQKSGYDARLFALLVLAARYKRDFDQLPESSRGKAQLAVPHFYAWMRMGLPQDFDLLLLSNPAQKMELLKKAIDEKLIDTIYDDDQELPAQLNYIAQNYKPVYQVSSVQELLNAWMPASVVLQTKFVEHFSTKNLSLDEAWKTLPGVEGFDTAKVEQLKSDVSLSNFLLDNASLQTKIKKELGSYDLIGKQLYKPNQWKSYLKDQPVPWFIKGDDDAQKKENYANYLAKSLELNHPTEVLADRVLQNEVKIVESLQQNVGRFLKNAAQNHGFDIGTTNLKTFLGPHNQIAFQGITDNKKEQQLIIAEVKKLRRVYQLTPDDATAQKLLTANLDSAAAIATMPLQQYLEKTRKQTVSDELAMGIRQKGKTIYGLNTLAQLMTESAKTMPPVRSLNDKQPEPLNSEPTPQASDSTAPPTSAPQTGTSATVQAEPASLEVDADLQNLFGSFDYCECDPCRSLTSPAAYLFDLLDFVSSLSNATESEAKNPINVLFSRRPDIEHLPLTCDNTNKLVPYIDIVNEILGFYIAEKASNPTQIPKLDDILKLENRSDFSQERVLSEPQYRSDTAYKLLADYTTGFQAPFERNKEYQRAYAQQLGVLLHEWLYTKSETAIEQDLSGLDVRETIFPTVFEYIQVSRHEFNTIFSKISDSGSLATFYGVTSLTELIKVDTLLNKSGLTFKELNQLLQSSHFEGVKIKLPQEAEDSCNTGIFTLRTPVPDSFWQQLYFALRIKRKLNWEWSTLLLLLEQVKPDFSSNEAVRKTLFRVIQHKWLLDQLGFQRTSTILTWYAALPSVEQRKRLLCHSLGISTDEWLGWANLTMLKDDDLTNTQVVILFLWRFRQVKKSGLSLNELNYLFLHKFKDKKEESIHKQKFRETIIAIRQSLDGANADYFTIDENDYNETSFQRLFSLIADKEIVEEMSAVLSGKLSFVIPLMVEPEDAEGDDVEQQKSLVIEDWKKKLQEQDDITGITIGPEGNLYVTRLLSNVVLDKLNIILNQDITNQYNQQAEPIQSFFQRALTRINPELGKSWESYLSYKSLILKIIPDVQTQYLTQLTYQIVATRLGIAPDQIAYLLNQVFTSTSADFEPNFPDLHTQKLSLIEAKPFHILLQEIAPYKIYAVDDDTVQALSDQNNTQPDSLAEVHPPDSPNQRKITYEWSVGIKARTTIPDSIIWNITSIQLNALEQKFSQLNKLALLIRKFTLSVDDLSELGKQLGANFISQFIPNPQTPQITTSQLIGNLDALVTYLVLKNDLTGGKMSLNRLFPEITPNGDNPSQRLTEFATAWDKALLEEVLNKQEWDGTYKNLVNLNQKIKICQKLSIPLALLDLLSEAGENTEKTTLFVEAYKKLIGETAWLAFNKDVNDPLRIKERDALIAYVLQKAIVATCKTPDDLYEHFLVDVLMEPAVKTSRLVLATSAVQLFVQRYFMNLEKYVQSLPTDDLEEKQEEWKWRKNYRVWEANRKVLFYPENWLDPEFRTDKTELFAQLESELLQGDVNTESVEKALTGYVQGLMDIGRLEICGLHTERDALNKPTMVHVIGRTFNTPHKYYYRTYRPPQAADEKGNGQWSNWNKVDCQIDGDHIMPVIWQGNLFIFWLTFLEKGEKASFHAESSTVNAKRIAEVQIAWTELRYGKWQARKSSNVEKNVYKIDLNKVDPQTNYKALVESYVNVDNVKGLKISIYSPHGAAGGQNIYTLKGRNSLFIVSEFNAWLSVDKTPVPPFDNCEPSFNLFTLTKQPGNLLSSGGEQIVLGKEKVIDSSVSTLQFCLDSSTKQFINGINYFFMQDGYHTYFVKAVTSHTAKETESVKPEKHDKLLGAISPGILSDKLLPIHKLGTEAITFDGIPLGIIGRLENQLKQVFVLQTF